MSIVSDTSAFFVVVGVSWLVIGIALSIVMGRRGHNSFGWLVLGTLLGPLGVVLAIDAWWHSEQAPPAPLGAGIPPIMGTGPVDVLVGFDGSPESIAAIDAVVELFGDRLGRLTVTTVVPFGDIRLQERLAREALLRLEGRTPGWTLELEVLLHGHPSVAIGQYATDNDYDVIAVGTRGTGITKAILGSAGEGWPAVPRSRSFPWTTPTRLSSPTPIWSWHGGHRSPRRRHRSVAITSERVSDRRPTGRPGLAVATQTNSR